LAIDLVLLNGYYKTTFVDKYPVMDDQNITHFENIFKKNIFCGS